RISGGKVGECQTIFQFGSAQEEVNETGVESISGPDIVHRLNLRRTETPLFVAGATYRRSRASLHHHHLGQASQKIESMREILCMRDFLGLAIVGQKDIHILQNLVQVLLPAVFRIIVGIERRRQTRFFGLTKQVYDSRAERAVQVERGKMQMASSPQ